MDKQGEAKRELTSRVEEIAAALQASYEADIDLLTRRDKAHVARIAELTAQVDELSRMISLEFNQSLTGGTKEARDVE